ncbi:CDP-glycerol glycerophosphotransferase family protein [Brevibacterium oceani]|uniref:CDP-glycerol glycerophosphotransferase family protein n=1 Tax=Brevibacterium oceani TaxID=358099 RepID=UPI001B321BCC|nr:CDP-glycerol glycerophosphotransferase family protein [Brevibacterium oceani]
MGQLQIHDVEVASDLNFAERINRLLDHVDTEYVLVAPQHGRLAPGTIFAMLAKFSDPRVDFVSANVKHISDVGDVNSPGLAETHNKDRVIDFHDGYVGLNDTDLSNKLFRTKFLKSVAQNSIGRHLSAEISVVLEAFCRSELFAVSNQVLVEVPYPSESAALRRYRSNQLDLEREIAKVENGIDALSGDDRLEVAHRWKIHAFDSLLSPYYQLIPRVDNCYWESFVSKIRSFKQYMTDGILGELNVHNRILLHLISSGNREDCEAVSYSRSDLGSKYRIEFKDGRPVAVPNYLTYLVEPIPDHLLECRAEEIVLETGILDYSWLSSTVLSITGCAWVSGIDLSRCDHETHIELINISTGEQHRLETKQVEFPRIDLISNDRNLSYSRAGFITEIDTGVLPGVEDASVGASPVWRVRVTTSVAGLEVASDFKWRDRTGAGARLDVQPINYGSRLVPAFTADRGLELTFDRPRYIVDSIVRQGRVFNVRVWSPFGSIASRLRATSAETGQTSFASLVSFDGETAEYELSLPSASAETRSSTEWEWKLVAESRDLPPVPLAWSGSERDLEASIDPGQALTLSLTGYGYLRMLERRWRMVVTDCEITADGTEIVFSGICDVDARNAPQFVLHNSRSSIDAVETKVTISSKPGGNVFETRFQLKAEAWGYEGLARPAGAYSLRYVPRGADAAKGHWLLASSQLSNRMPKRFSAYKSSIEVSRTSKKGAVKVHIRPDLTDYEFTRQGQRSLQLKYFTGNEVNLSAPARGRYVVVECFGGRRATDTVLELVNRIQLDYPDTPIYWGISDHSVPLPPGVHGIIIDSEEWYRRLSDARLLINNNNFPHYFRKRAGQYYLQTWHGTPLKRLVFDVERSNFSLSYWALMAREAGYWDLLIGQSESAAQVLAKAFHYDGELFYDGYPRNDVLKSTDAAERGQLVKASLGIDPGQKVLLYAPTWRDNVKATSSQYAMVTYLDFDAFAKALGQEWTILLRGHHNVANSRRVSAVDIIDVTDHPSVNDLYLVADALVTDYSSVMFDYAVTGKQIVYLAPDIDAYGDSTRGFYFDLSDAAPGPIVKTTVGVIDALRHMTLTQWRYIVKRKEFSQRFAPRDDGNATERLYERLPLESIFD